MKESCLLHPESQITKKELKTKDLLSLKIKEISSSFQNVSYKYVPYKNVLTISIHKYILVV